MPLPPPVTMKLFPSTVIDPTVIDIDVRFKQRADSGAGLTRTSGCHPDPGQVMRAGTA